MTAVYFEHVNQLGVGLADKGVREVVGAFKLHVKA